MRNNAKKIEVRIIIVGSILLFFNNSINILSVMGSMLLTLTILLLIALFMLGVFFLSDMLSFVHTRIMVVRHFVNTNSGVFTIFFMLLFFLEQMLLILVAYLLNVEAKAQLTIGIFALIVLTTATLEKFLLEKKYGYLKEVVTSIGLENERALDAYKQISGAYEELYTEHQKLKQKR